MPITLTIPNEYGYVLLAATSTAVIHYWHSNLVGSHRRAAGVSYPNAYAPASEAAISKEKYLFNCAQRAHANYLEALPSLLVTLLISGLKYPSVSAGLGAVWGVGRIVYTLGYTGKNQSMDSKGKGRYAGIWHYLPALALLVTSGISSWSMITA
ncbi:hypothetical protein MMC14_002525 [Varicellaria rhodocarpa]|nr:hypothetical protein [Varicellaria rhodocarpa]